VYRATMPLDVAKNISGIIYMPDEVVIVKLNGSTS
jgi:hypothetical protein